MYQQRFEKSGDICWFGENDISTNDEFLNEDVDHSETKEVSPDVLAKAIDMHICRVSCEQLLAILRAVVEGASRLKRLRLSFLDPMDIVDVVDVDKDLIGRAREAVGEFFILEDFYSEEIEDIDIDFSFLQQPFYLAAHDQNGL